MSARNSRQKRLLRKKLAKKKGSRCAICGKEGKMTLDHIVPISRGGSWHRSNLQLLCYDCNQQKADRLMDELAP